jgi:hypothetical protein
VQFLGVAQPSGAAAVLFPDCLAPENRIATHIVAIMIEMRGGKFKRNLTKKS